MTIIDMNDAAARRMTDDEKRDAARDLARRDPAISGAELARRFDKPAWWGRDQARIAREGKRRGSNVTASRRPKRDTPRRGPMHGPPEPEPVAVPPAEDPTEPAPPSRAVRYVQVAGVVVVAAVAAVISYTHMRHLALLAGEGWRADILPLSVDGMMVVASMNALERRRAGKRAWLAWAGLLLGLGASFAANVAAAQPTLVGRLVAAWPPVALLVALELLLHRGDDQ